MASAWKTLRRTLAYFRRSAHHAVNLVLAIFLAGQTVLAFYLARRDVLEPPEFLVERLRSEFGLRGLRLDWDRAVFDWQGNVRVDRPRFGPSLSGETWVSADVALARLDRVSLLLGRVRWRELSVENLAVNSAGGGQPLVEGLSANLGSSLGEITVRHAYGRILGVPVAATGAVGDPSRWFVAETVAPAAPAAPPGPPRDLAAVIRPLLAEASLWPALLEPWRGASVRATLVPSAEGPPRASLAVSGPGGFSAVVPGAAGPSGEPLACSFRDWELTVGECGVQDWRERRVPAVRIRLGHFEIPQAVALERLRLETLPAVFPAGEEGWRQWLHSARPRLSAGSVSALGQTVGPVAFATTGLDRWPALEGRLWTRWEGRPISLAGRFNPVEGSADAVAEADVSYDDILQRLPEKIARELSSRLGWNGSVHLSPRVVLSPGWKFERVELGATLPSVSLKPGTRWDELTFRAEATPRGIRVDRASTLCREAGYSAVASYEQEWADTAFLLQVEGTVRPRDLDPVIRDEWWTRLWKDLTDFPTLPFAVVSVGGRWNRPSEICARVAATLPTGGKYQGVPTSEGYVLVVHTPHLTELADLKVSRAGGEWLRGSLGWIDSRHLPVPRDEPVTMNVSLDLRATLSEVAPLLGPDFAAVAGSLRLSKAPRLSISGWSRDHATPKDFDWKIQAETEGPSGWKQFDFEALALDIRVRPGRLDLGNVKGRFLDGDLTGTVVMTTPGDLLDLDLSLANSSWPRLIEWAKHNQSALGPASPAASPAPAEPAAAPDTLGRSWLTLKATGPAADPLSFAGTGTLRVEEADLQTVRIFGGLSRLLETVGIGFATFEFKRLESGFNLKDKSVQLNNFRIQGPRARLQATGMARLADRALDVDAELDLGKPADKKGIFGKIISLPFDTLTKLLPIKLYGTLDNPEWRFRADPRSLIFGQPGMKPEKTPEKETVPAK